MLYSYPYFGCFFIISVQLKRFFPDIFVNNLYYAYFLCSFLLNNFSSIILYSLTFNRKIFLNF